MIDWFAAHGLLSLMIVAFAAGTIGGLFGMWVFGTWR